MKKLMAKEPAYLFIYFTGACINDDEILLSQTNPLIYSRIEAIARNYI
jgi:hypothetical protein